MASVNPPATHPVRGRGLVSHGDTVGVRELHESAHPHERGRTREGRPRSPSADSRSDGSTGTAAITVRVGTARDSPMDVGHPPVTVRSCSTTHAYWRRILPGPRLMARALHDYTAMLPRVRPRRVRPDCGKNTACRDPRRRFSAALMRRLAASRSCSRTSVRRAALAVYHRRRTAHLLRVRSPAAANDGVIAHRSRSKASASRRRRCRECATCRC